MTDVFELHFFFRTGPVVFSPAAHRADHIPPHYGAEPIRVSTGGWAGNCHLAGNQVKGGDRQFAGPHRLAMSRAESPVMGVEFWHEIFAARASAKTTGIVQWRAPAPVMRAVCERNQQDSILSHFATHR